MGQFQRKFIYILADCFLIECSEFANMNVKLSFDSKISIESRAREKKVDPIQRYGEKKVKFISE